jgi:hypothetical protein
MRYCRAPTHDGRPLWNVIRKQKFHRQDFGPKSKETEIMKKSEPLERNRSVKDKSAKEKNVTKDSSVSTQLNTLEEKNERLDSFLLPWGSFLSFFSVHDTTRCYRLKMTRM